MAKPQSLQICLMLDSIYFIDVFPIVNVGEDCPVFDGLYEFCQLSSGGSVGKIQVQLMQMW